MSKRKGKNDGQSRTTGVHAKNVQSDHASAGRATVEAPDGRGLAVGQAENQPGAAAAPEPATKNPEGQDVNAPSDVPADGNAADNQSKDAGAQAAATDDKANPPANGGGGGGDGAAGAETEAVNLDQDATRYFGGTAGGAMDPDGNPPSGEAPPVFCADHKAGEDAEPNVLAAMFAASALRYPFAGSPADFESDLKIFTALAEFFRTFPDSPDESGPVQLQRLKIELPEEHRPGLLMAMIRVFRVALDQLDRLDREDAARAEAEKPKPEPEAWREPRGFKQTKKAMDPKSGLKVRR